MRMTWDGLFLLGPRGWERLAPPMPGYPQAHQSQPQVYSRQPYAYMTQPAPYQYQSHYNQPPVHNSIPYATANASYSNQPPMAGYHIPGANATFQQPHSAHYLGYPQPISPIHGQPTFPTSRADSYYPTNQNNSWHQSLPIQTQSQPAVVHSNTALASPVPQRSYRLPTLIHSSPTPTASESHFVQGTRTIEPVSTSPCPTYPRSGTLLTGSPNPFDSAKPVPASRRKRKSPVTRISPSNPRLKPSSVGTGISSPGPRSQNPKMQKFIPNNKAIKESPSDPSPAPLIPRFPPKVEDLDRLVLKVGKEATKDEYVIAYPFFLTIFLLHDG